MLNHYPLWKNLLIVAVILVCGFYALPNLYGKDPAIQISSETQDKPVNAALLAKVDGILAKNNIQPLKSTLADDRIILRFKTLDDQGNANDKLEQALDTNYIRSLNLESLTPEWLSALGGEQMNLGLDLRGGVHFLMEVEMDEIVTRQIKTNVETLKTMFREEKLRYIPPLTSHDEVITIKFKNSDIRNAAHDLVRDSDKLSGMTLIERDEDGKPALILTFSEQEKQAIEKRAIEQNMSTLRNRINELGVAEPIVQRQGANRIVVQLPGVQDPYRARIIIGSIASLSMHLVDQKNSAYDAAQTGKIPPGSLLKYTPEPEKDPVLLHKRTMVTGENILNATSGLDQDSNTPAVFITMDGEGAAKMYAGTKDNIGKPMAVLFIEDKINIRKGEDGKYITDKKRIEEVINVATIRDALSKKFQITGLDSAEEARDLALLIRAGSLAAPMAIIEERTVGPSLGKDNINQGFLSVVVGMALVLVFMAIYYRVFGLVADLALVINVVMIVALLSMIQATLTLPGIAGIVLTVGMAVDANVLIFERIREELRLGNSIQASIHSGYEKALSTIADANITTLIAAAVLWFFGTGPVKGFAVTLTFGIITSMFTAILGTRAVINWIYGGKRLEKISI
jgi:preprotein translocase subunit SecD